jgi:hypothetical protein
MKETWRMQEHFLSLDIHGVVYSRCWWACVCPSMYPNKLLAFQCRILPCYEIRSSVSLWHPRTLCSWNKIISSRDSARLVAGRSGVWIVAGAVNLSACLKCPDRLWGPPSLLFSGYPRLFPFGWSGRVVIMFNYKPISPGSFILWSVYDRSIVSSKVNSPRCAI